MIQTTPWQKFIDEEGGQHPNETQLDFLQRFYEWMVEFGPEMTDDTEEGADADSQEGRRRGGHGS